MGIISRIYEFIDYKDVTVNEFSNKIGVSNGYFAKQRSVNGNVSSRIIEKIVNLYPEISLEWLILGKGNMCIENSNKSNSLQPLSNEKVSHTIDSQEIPLYDISAAAGCVMLFQDSNNMVPIDTIKIPNLAKCDGAVFARGDSMYPIIKSGDIILYKVMQGLDTIIWGETYIVTYESYGDYYTVVKYVKKSTEHDGNLVLLSQNEHHQPFEIHISQVKSMALVRASVRYNNM